MELHAIMPSRLSGLLAVAQRWTAWMVEQTIRNRENHRRIARSRAPTWQLCCKSSPPARWCRTRSSRPSHWGTSMHPTPSVWAAQAALKDQMEPTIVFRHNSIRHRRLTRIDQMTTQQTARSSTGSIPASTSNQPTRQIASSRWTPPAGSTRTIQHWPRIPKGTNKTL